MRCAGDHRSAGELMSKGKEYKALYEEHMQRASDASATAMCAPSLALKSATVTAQDSDGRRVPLMKEDNGTTWLYYGKRGEARSDMV